MGGGAASGARAPEREPAERGAVARASPSSARITPDVSSLPKKGEGHDFPAETLQELKDQYEPLFVEIEAAGHQTFPLKEEDGLMLSAGFLGTPGGVAEPHVDSDDVEKILRDLEPPEGKTPLVRLFVCAASYRDPRDGEGAAVRASGQGTEAAFGVVLPEPFLQVAFLPLPVIPHLKITDRGLVDVDRFEFVRD